MILSVLRSGTNVKRLPGRHERSINKTIKIFFQVANLLVPNIRIVLWVVLVPNTISELQVLIDPFLHSEIYQGVDNIDLLVFLVIWQILIHSPRVSIFLTVFK